MKKLISALLVLSMLLMIAVAFATEADADEWDEDEFVVDSKSGDDISTVTVYTGDEDDDGLVIEIVEDTEETTKLKEKIAEAIKNGDLTAVIPEDVLSKIPEEYRNAENLADNVKEFVTVTVMGDITDVDNAVAKFSFATPYEEGEELYILFAFTDGEEVKEWILKKGIVKDGLVEVALTHAELEKMLNQKFAAIVFNK